MALEMFNYDWAELKERFADHAQINIPEPKIIRERKNMSNVPIINCIGIEFETESLIPGTLPREFRNDWNEDHDASIESFAWRKNGVVYKTQVANGQRIKLGTELVSTILYSEKEEFKNIIRNILNWVQEQGELEESFRAGIHIHVSMPTHIRIVKNIINLGAHLEQVFFYLGGMGYQFRGIQNDCTYCRPITKFGPSCVKYDRSGIQCFNIKDLLEAKDLQDFWYKYGGIDMNSVMGKYNPMRYTWLTLYPLLTKGTIEFRIFNKTLNYYYLTAIIEFVKKFCEVALMGSFEFPENSIYDKHTKNGVLKTLYEFSKYVNLDDSTLSILSKIIQRTPEITLEPKYFWSHLLYTKYNKLESLPWSYYVPTKISKTIIFEPKFVDIHRLGDE